MKLIIIAFLFMAAGCVFGFMLGAVLAASKRADIYSEQYIINSKHTEGDQDRD